MAVESTHKRKRMANIELLRILAMIMVVMLHFLGKGGVLPELTGSLDAKGYLAWAMEALSIAAVNVYVLISGYFLVETGFKCGRLVRLILQVLFYSLLVPVCLLAAGVLKVQDITIYQLLQYLLPVQMLQYWFVTAYVLLYLFSPFLGTAVRHMSKRQLQFTLTFLLLFLSAGKSVLPVRLEMDNFGYDAIWFICVYLVAAYIRLYGIPLYKNRRISVGMYLAGCAAIFGVTMVVRAVYLKFDIFEYFIKAAYDYNHLLNLFAAVSLFYAFYHLKLKEGRLSAWICRLSRYTFGVYLLHEQLEIRYLWPGWLGAGRVQSPVLFAAYACACVLLVFMAGILVDALREMLFQGVQKLLKSTRIFKWISRLEIPAK